MNAHMDPVERRVVATNEIKRMCADLLERVESGPRRRGRTTHQTAENFEKIMEAVRLAQFEAICMEGAA
ncbi:MAG TPA: hypothetical protein VKB96_10995 [Gammaproteobacteria bacterium]|nr:hypothetical protein [Gammaproteobacteria bacterium]